jgi:HJR/Mrr/RecB family endonuclease
VTWLFTQVQSGYRRRLLDWTTDLRRLSAQEFEWIVGEVLRREGWNVEETGGDGEPDGNVDLRIERDGRECLVQCKRWQSWAVGVDEVRKLAGTLMRDGLPGSAGIFVTLSTFTEPAVREAKGLGIELVDGAALARRIDSVRAGEPCPACGTPMLLRKSSRGWWLRCPRWSEGCSGKRDLSDQPATAIGLLFAG